MKLVKSAYGLVQAPRQYYLLCEEVYAKCKLTVSTSYRLRVDKTLGEGGTGSTREQYDVFYSKYRDETHDCDTVGAQRSGSKVELSLAVMLLLYLR